MPKYRYTVVNKENKQLSGTIGAPDEKNAREELNQLGFSILELGEISGETETPAEGKPLPKFEFAAIDKNMKRVVGTIQAQDRYSAYKRLIAEYQFEVEYLVDLSLSEPEKELMRQKGIYELQNKLDEEGLELKKKEPTEQFDFQEFVGKQEVMQSQVEFVLKKVKELLDLYEPQIKPETKMKIRQLVDKILRIKNSTNLDYIRKSCEDLLNFLQQEELFLNEETHEKERTKLAVEAKGMMMQLHQTKANQDILMGLREWREKHILGSEQPTLAQQLMNFLMGFVIGFTPDNDEIKLIRQDILRVKQQWKQYFTLYFQAGTSEFKMEAREGMKRMWQEKKRLRKKLKQAKRLYRKELKSLGQHTPIEHLANEMLSFTGWLLAFYLLYYFGSLYLESKDLGIAPLPQTFSVYHSTFLKYFLTTLFLLHSTLSIKIHFFRRSEIATVIITPVFLLSMLLILLNF